MKTFRLVALSCGGLAVPLCSHFPLRQIFVMQDFVHLHVHTQYSLLDGQASVSRLVDKAIQDGMKGIAVTDHGNMFGIKEFVNYVNKKNSGTRDEIKAPPLPHAVPSWPRPKAGCSSPS